MMHTFSACSLCFSPKGFLLCVLLFCAGATFSQELCNNATDDDGDGLIDLNDTDDCACTLGNSNEPVLSILPNPSFEEFDNCPFIPSQIEFTQSWRNVTNTTTDYLNTCGFTSLAAFTEDLLPFPDGNACLGLIFADSWREHVFACLDNPLEANVAYQLNLSIASLPVTDNDIEWSVCNGGNIYYGSTEVTVYGALACPEGSTQTGGCLNTADPSWIVLGSASYTPVGEWSELSVHFTPVENVLAIAIGAPCELGAGYDQLVGVCYPYFYLDNLILNKAVLFDPPALSILSEGDNCEGTLVLSAQIEGNPSPGAALQWYLNGIAIIGEDGDQLNTGGEALASGLYQFTVTADGFCAVSDSLFIDSMPVEVLVAGGNICEGDSIKLIATNAESYLWESGETTPSITVSPLVSTSYLVTGSIGNCIDTEIAAVEVFPAPIITVGSDLSIEEGAAILLQSTATGNSIFWSPQIGLSCSNCNNPMASPSSTTEYCATTSINGCSASDCLVLTVIPPCATNNKYELPTAFSPNDDGVNDLYCLEGWVNCVISYQLNIYNYWGQRVFTSSGPEQCWDGTQSGQKLMPGVFVFHLVASLNGGGSISRKGNISLIR